MNSNTSESDAACAQWETLEEARDFAHKIEQERNNQKEIVVQMQAERDHYRDKLQKAQKQLTFLESKGLTVGTMKTSDKPDPYLVYVCKPDSEFDNTIYINKLIDLEIENDKLRKACATLAKHGECCHGPGKDPLCGTCKAIDLYNSIPPAKRN